jgi:DNA polymerase/3'-5' exonuclease PolX
MNPVNQEVAGRLEAVARLLRDQGADRYRVGAHLRAAASIRSMQTPVDEVLRDHGLEGLKQLPSVGESIARAIRELVTHGRLPMLDRLRGEGDPVMLLASAPGIGRVLADRLTKNWDWRLSRISRLRLTMAGWRRWRVSGSSASPESEILWLIV